MFLFVNANFCEIVSVMGDWGMVLYVVMRGRVLADVSIWRRLKKMGGAAIQRRFLS